MPSHGVAWQVVQVTVVVLALLVLGVSLALTPDPSGANTHTQLGLPPCPTLARTGWPCLTCGMTTAFAHAARLQLKQSFLCQPFGTALFLGLMSLAGGASINVLRRRSWHPDLSRLRLSTALGVTGLLLTLFVAAWAFKARGQIAARLGWVVTHTSGTTGGAAAQR